MSNNEKDTKLFSEELGELPENDDDVDWKAEAERLHKAAEEREGIAKRNYSDLTKTKGKLEELSKSPGTETAPQGKESEPTPDNKQGFDYGQIAYLEAKGVPEEHHERLQTLTQETGMELKELMKRDWVQNELKEAKEKAETKDATPKGTKPSGTSEKDVDFWASKGPGGELPEDKELARKVVKKRQENEKKANKFTNNPVV